jgi:hypothetical protein
VLACVRRDHIDNELAQSVEHRCLSNETCCDLYGAEHEPAQSARISRVH